MDNLEQALIAIALVIFSTLFFEKRKSKYRDDKDDQQQNGKKHGKKNE